MKEVVKVLLQEGIDEETIHEVLQVIEENYEFVNELKDETKLSAGKKRVDNVVKSAQRQNELEKEYKNAETLDDKTENMFKQAEQVKKVIDATNKFNKFNKLAGRGFFSKIKDPKIRDEYKEYALKEIDKVNRNK